MPDARHGGDMRLGSRIDTTRFMENGMGAPIDADRSTRTEASPGNSPWHNRDFVLLWSGQAVSILGAQIAFLAVPLLALALTRSPAQAGFVEAVGSLPYLALALPAGALVDRWDRKATMVWCELTRALAFGSVPLAYAVGHLSMPQLYVVAAVAGGAFVVFDLANSATLPRVVPPAQVPRASALIGTATWTVSLVGPGLGGALIGLTGTTARGSVLAYGVNGLSFLVSAGSLLLMRVAFQEERDPGAGQTVRTLRAEIIEGARFFLAHAHLRLLALLDASMSLLAGPATLTVTVLARTLLHADARTIGLIFSVLSAGGVIGSLIAPRIATRVPFGTIVVGAFATMAFAALLLAAAVVPAMLMLGGGIVVLAATIYSIPQNAYRLSLIPDGLQGRVNSAFRLLFFGIEPLSMAATGVLLGLVGPRIVFVLIAAIVGMGGLMASRTSLRRATLH